MKVGCVKEIKNNEFRVGMTPDNVKSYVNAGHDVYIEKGAGEGSGFLDAEYVAAGAKMIDTAKEVWDTVEMMIKVKEPLPEEYPLFHEGLILYTYLHLAADKPQTDALLGAKVKGVAYETLIERNGSIPLLAPMSQIAGRLSIQEGAKYLEKRGEGVHHVAFCVEDGVGAALQEAESKGIRLIDKAPRLGAESLHIGFLHPKSTIGILTELCEH